MPQGGLGPGPQDRGPGAFGHLLGQRHLVVAPMARLCLMDIERGRQPAISDERRDDDGALAGPDELRRNGLIRGAWIRQGIIDADRVSGLQLAVDLRTKVIEAILGRRSSGLTASVQSRSTAKDSPLAVEFGITGAVRAQVAAEHLGGRGHDILRLGNPRRRVLRSTRNRSRCSVSTRSVVSCR